MKNNYNSVISFLFIVVVLYGIYFFMMPQWASNNDSLSEFSTERALEHIKKIAEKPHFVGSENHQEVVIYLEKELQKLGLETKIQEGTTLNSSGLLLKSRNILARIKGSNSTKTLLLLSHYDSAPHSFSHGASDNASGLATILEGLRAFLHSKTTHKNDIIILFSDGEELGLNGAALFVTQSDWAKKIGLVLNFEARGSSGPSYMLMEVNQGNAALIDGFTTANPKYPVSNSLMYNIYKMLPNDTDLTVFKEMGEIQGFNFAFIDNHFNYHTAQDNFANINQNSIAHQGTYLMPLLKYFSNTDINNLNSKENFVFFNIPFYFISYPYSWGLPLCIVAAALFLLLVIIGIGKRILIGSEILKGFLILIGLLLVTGLTTYILWNLLLNIYPQYNDILQGFTYNGYLYILAFILLSLALGFCFSLKIKNENLAINRFIGPLFLWIIINFVMVYYLPGGSFFIIPVFFALFKLAIFVITQKTNAFINLIFSIPALFIFTPYIVMLPIGLGLKILYGSSLLTILVFGLLLPVFGAFTKKSIWAVFLFLLSIATFVTAHFESGYKEGKAKPNSLLYLLDADKNKAIWTTYDTNLDEWTKKYLGDNPKRSSIKNSNLLYSKYNTELTYSARAIYKNIAKPNIEFLKDSIIGTQRYLKIRISPNRKVNRYDIFANEKMVFNNLIANNTKALGQEGSLYKRKGNRILSYYVINNEPLLLQFSIPKKSILDMELMESSFDLLYNPVFKMKSRENWMMPTPFVLTDAVVIQQKIRPTIPIVPKILVPTTTMIIAKDSTSQNIDTLKIK